MDKNVMGTTGLIVSLIFIFWITINLPKWVNPAGLIIEPLWVFLVGIVIFSAVVVGIYRLFH